MCAFSSVRRLLLSYHVISILFLATSCRCAPALGSNATGAGPVNRASAGGTASSPAGTLGPQVSKRARRAPRVRSRGWGGRVSARASNRLRRRARRGARRAPVLSHSRARAETPPTAARGPGLAAEATARRRSAAPTAMPPARKAEHRAAQRAAQRAALASPHLLPAAGPRGRRRASPSNSCVGGSCCRRRFALFAASGIARLVISPAAA